MEEVGERVTGTRAEDEERPLHEFQTLASHSSSPNDSTIGRDIESTQFLVCIAQTVRTGMEMRGCSVEWEG